MCWASSSIARCAEYLWNCEKTVLVNPLGHNDETKPENGLRVSPLEDQKKTERMLSTRARLQQGWAIVFSSKNTLSFFTEVRKQIIIFSFF